MIESASNSLARSILAASWPQGLSPDAAHAVDDRSRAAPDPVRAAQSSPSFTPALTAPALTLPGPEPVPGADEGASSRQGQGRKRPAGQASAAYAAAGRPGAAGSPSSLDVRV